MLCFIPTWSHATENRSSACWGLGCWRRGCKQLQIPCKRQTINLPASSNNTAVDSAVIFYPVYIDYEDELW